MTIKKYITNPYEKTLKTIPISEKNINSEIYESPQETIIFLGNSHISPDIYKINSITPQFKIIDDKEYFNIGDPSLFMEIDFKNRIDLMQQNLANAIIRICINKILNTLFLDYSINSSENKIYLSDSDISFSDINKLEDLSNYIINANLNINFNEDYSEISIKGFGSTDYDGPCLKRTGEISLIKISNIKKINDNIILELVAGNRALLDYRNKINIIEKLKKILMTTNDEHLLKEIENLKVKYEDVKNENKKLEKYLGLESVKLYKNSSININGINYIFRIVNNINFRDLKFISQHIINDPNYIQIYGIPNGSKAQILVSRSKNLNLDIKNIYDKIANKFSLSGSGNMLYIQANLSSNNLDITMNTFLEEIKNTIKNDK